MKQPHYTSVATDVYDENASDTFTLHVRVDSHGALIIDDDPVVEGGTFNIIVENRQGVPYLIVWKQEDFWNDPTFTIRLDTGEIE